MSNKKMKPVWRLNLGRGAPSDIGDHVIYFDMKLAKASDVKRHIDGLWKINKKPVYFDIYAYQTNRFKEAKRGN